VREAVKSLASQNILEVVRGRGTFVSQTPGISSDPLGLDFLADRNLPTSLIEARQLIEPTVARLAAERAVAEDVERLERFVREMGRILDHHRGWTEAELGFHRAVAQATRNPVIMRLLPVIHEAIIKTLQYAPRTSADHRQAFDEHRAILEAIRGNAPPEAFTAMQRHLMNSYNRTVSIGSVNHDRPP
jgi:DNA-binding FadR family transcriptional regulator